MAAAHRRGGKHAVKDEDLTHTKYDYYTREELLAAVKEAGCFVKDDKKSVMAKKLAKYDQDLMQIARRTAQEQKEKEEKRQQEVKETFQACKQRRRARAKRNDDKGRRRERGEDVSSNSEDTDDIDEQNRHNAQRLTVTGGYALSDETWDDTSTESTIRSENSPIWPGCRLRLFEWSYTTMPPSRPSSKNRTEQIPTQITYVPLKLSTIHSREKVTLPGSRYPAGINPDYVPILDPLTRAAARHGHMINLLSHASIEPATTWASRTIVQGWNGRIYLALPPHNNNKDLQLDAVYRKWKIEKSKLLRPAPRTVNPKRDRSQRFAQRLVNKRKATAEVYEACKWRPLALSYMPSYLDWEKGIDSVLLSNHERTIENLFYIRFSGCDLPHYYFWACKREWNDPATADLAWTPASFQKPSIGGIVQDKWVALDGTGLPSHSLTKIKKVRPVVLSNHHSSDLSSVEDNLITRGLSATLSRYRAVATSIGKERAWNAFMRKLPKLYPSGAVPNAPPARAMQGMCVAEKIANLLSGRVFLPFTGAERWTRDDDAMWEVVMYSSSDDVDMYEDDSLEELEDLPSSRSSGDSETVDNLSANVLYRRDSMDLLTQRPQYRQDNDIYAWLEHISSAYPPHTVPLSPTVPNENVGPEVLTLTSNAFPSANYTSPTCSFCNANWTALVDFEKASHMLSHSYTDLQHTTTAISRINATGAGAKRRYSRLSITTLRSYNARKKIPRLDSATALTEQWANLGRHDSPFTKELRRAQTSDRTRTLERRQSAVSLSVTCTETMMLESPSSSCFADDEQEVEH